MSCNNTNETPIMVLKYRPFGRFSFFLWFLVVFMIFYIGGFVFTPEEAAELKANYYFLKYGSIIFGGFLMISYLDGMNIKQIEVYNDKIVKLPVIYLPVIGRKVCIELDKAYYIEYFAGIQLGDPKFIFSTPLFHYLLNWSIIDIPYTRLTNKDEFIAFLSKISGRPESHFRYLSTASFQRKLIESKTYTKEG